MKFENGLVSLSNIEVSETGFNTPFVPHIEMVLEKLDTCAAAYEAYEEVRMQPDLQMTYEQQQKFLADIKRNVCRERIMRRVLDHIIDQESAKFLSGHASK